MVHCSRWGVLGAAIVVAALGSPARGASFLEKNFWLEGPRYEAAVPTCDDPAALGNIQARFSEKEGTYWNSALKIVDFLRVREVAFRPWAVDTIPRRFCSGTVLTSDGVKRRVDFLIGEDTGMIGAGWGVTWCVAGLDRNWTYNPSCRMARP